MSFCESYKHLEKLCSEILNDDKPVKAYIAAMENTPNGHYYVKDWKEDLKKLKHYHWVRNKISHEPGCTEENMCELGDAEWLDAFYLRIMDQCDPLALYRKATAPRSAQRSSVFSSAPLPQLYSDSQKISDESRNRRALAAMIVVALVVATLAILAVSICLLSALFS